MRTTATRKLFRCRLKQRSGAPPELRLVVLARPDGQNDEVCGVDGEEEARADHKVTERWEGGRADLASRVAHSGARRYH
jgi:hypothetical protein